jgi:tRNA(fMet)-specific endonuclease VapC
LKYVLDTNIVAHWLKGDVRILQRLSTIPSNEIGLSLLVIAELLFGAEKSARPGQNRARVEQLAQRLAILPITRTTVEHYAIERAQLERQGRPKSDIDLLIACTALEYGATLVTNDANLKDGNIPTLVAEDWLAPQ